MKLIELLIERASYSLNRPFTYTYNGKKDIQTGFRVEVEFNHQDLVGYVVGVKETDKSKAELEEELGFAIEEIKDVIDEAPLLSDELIQLSKMISEHYLSPTIAVLQTMLPTSLSPKSSSKNGPKIAYNQYLRCIDPKEDDLTAKQIEVLRLINSVDKVLKREIKSVSIVKKLLELHKIEEVLEEKRRLEIPHYEEEEKHPLTEDQQKVVDEFLSSEDKVFLLEGVTGSGKSEVYLHISDYILKEGKTVLMLVPEISLTPMMVEYFLKRFKGDVAILHSELTPAEKYDEYRKIASGEAHVVVGARSAIFAPLKNIGLIILDEEHTESYKQDVSPYYHAREVAIMRSEINGAKVLLGSATPSLESRARAQNHIYHLLTLTKRISDFGLPKTTIVNMLDYHNIDNNSYIFSHKMRTAIQKVLDNKEQAILLINRRGFSTHVSCRKCGYVFKCPNCGIALTYHKKDNMLKCHHCDHVELLGETCPECGSKYLMKTGFGTERIEEEVHKLFPEARTLRLDSDTAKIRTKIAKTVTAFARKEADILVGTQMIAKGHDFEDVTLVGIVLADIGLNMPSYRSSERAFQLITQAVGRSGRKNKKGEAIIQTYMPDHYAITMAARQDYELFYRKEMSLRKLQNYPPYCYLASITIQGKNEERVVETIYSLATDLTEKLSDKATVLGPISPYIAYQNDVHRRVILLKYRDVKEINKTLNDAIKVVSSISGVTIQVNIDPYDF